MIKPTKIPTDHRAHDVLLEYAYRCGYARGYETAVEAGLEGIPPEALNKISKVIRDWQNQAFKEPVPRFGDSWVPAPPARLGGIKGLLKDLGVSK